MLPIINREYLREWELAQTYATEAAAVEQEIIVLEAKWGRLTRLAQEHNGIMLKILEVDRESA